MQGRRLVDNMLLSGCWYLVMACEYVFSEAPSPLGLGRYESAQVVLKELVLGWESSVHQYIIHTYGEVCISTSCLDFIPSSTVENKKDVIPFTVGAVLKWKR